MTSTTFTIGQRGTVVIPAAMRKRLGLREGSLVIAEERDGGVLIRPAVAMPVEHYSPVRRAELILNNAVDAADYHRARETVREMGLDPDAIDHQRPNAA